MTIDFSDYLTKKQSFVLTLVVFYFLISPKTFSFTVKTCTASRCSYYIGLAFAFIWLYFADGLWPAWDCERNTVRRKEHEALSYFICKAFDYCAQNKIENVTHKLIYQHVNADMFRVGEQHSILIDIDKAAENQNMKYRFWKQNKWQCDHLSWRRCANES